MQYQRPSLEIIIKRKTHQIVSSNVVLEIEAWTGQFLGVSFNLKILTEFPKKITIAFIATQTKDPAYV